MKKLLLLTFIGAISASTVLHAQKIKREVVGKYTYTQLPIDIRLKSSKTYKIVGRGDNMDGYEKDNMSRAIYLSGFEKKDRNANDVDFKVDIEKYIIKFSDTEQKSSLKTIKKDGVEKKVKYYYYTCEATYKYVLKIFKDGEQIYKDINEGKDDIEGGENTSSKTAYENYKTKRKNYLNSATSEKVKEMNGAINEKFCILEKTTFLRSAHIKPKKHNYDDYVVSFEQMKNGYLIVAADENSIEKAKVDLTKAIDGFKIILKESDPENRKARINKKISALLYINIGHCYFMMKDYVAAAQNYANAMEYDKSFLDSRNMKRISEKLNKRVEANRIL